MFCRAFTVCGQCEKLRWYGQCIANGWRKIIFNLISRHFRSMCNLNIFLNHFWSHFSPFQINTQLEFCSQNGCRRPFWMTENHFWSHLSPFQINTQLFWWFFSQNGCRRPFWMTENHFWSHFSPFQINTQLFVVVEKTIGSSTMCYQWLCQIWSWIYDTVRDATSFLSIFIQNGHQRPFSFSDWCQKS